MKKIIIFFITILTVLTLFSFAASTFAKENMSSDSAKTKSTYMLAYPGILPDNPLYKLKVLRDKIIEFLTNDPVKKVDFYLLQTDKGLAATEMLVKKDKIDMAKETGLKAEHNYTKITYVIKGNKGKFSEKIYQKLYDAAEKHQEVLNSIIKSVPEDQKETFQTILYFSEQNVKEIRSLFSQL